MDLYALGNRIQHEDDHLSEEVVVLDSEGVEHDILSLNWDRENLRWVLVTELR